MKNRILSIILTLAIILTFCPSIVFAQDATDITTFSALKQALEAATAFDSILVTESITIPSGESLVVGEYITLKLQGDATSGKVLTVENGGSLTVNNGGLISSTFDVNQSYDSRDCVIVKAGGTFEDFAGVSIGSQGTINLTAGNIAISQVGASYDENDALDYAWAGFNLNFSADAVATVPAGKSLVIGTLAPWEYNIFNTYIKGTLNIEGQLSLINSMGTGSAVVFTNSTLNITGSIDFFNNQNSFGSIITEYNSTFILNGEKLIGNEASSDATLTLTKGFINYGISSIDDTKTWALILGEATVHRNTDKVGYIISYDFADENGNAVSSTLTIQKGLVLDVDYMAFFSSKIVTLTDSGKTVEMSAYLSEQVDVVDDVTTHHISTTPISTDDATADNKYDFKYYMPYSFDLAVSSAQTSIIKFNFFLEQYHTDNPNVSVGGILANPYTFYSLKESGKDLQFNVSNSTGKSLYAWSFDGEKIRSDYAEQSVNLSISLGGALPKDLNGASNPLLISTNQKGDLPTTDSNLKVFIGDKGYNPGDVVDFYYYNTNTSEYVLALNDITVDADGYIDVTITNCGDYVINNTKAVSEYMLGDVNNDKAINVNDVLMILQHITSKIILKDNGFIAGDVTKDGKIDVNDSMKMLQVITGKVSGF